MYEDETGRRNASGLPDPTYGGAARAIEAQGRRNCERCVRAMLAVADSMGCNVTRRIVLQDRRTGVVSG